MVAIFRTGTWSTGQAWLPPICCWGSGLNVELGIQPPRRGPELFSNHAGPERPRGEKDIASREGSLEVWLDSRARTV